MYPPMRKPLLDDLARADYGRFMEPTTTPRSCGACKEPIPEKARFCPFCGTPAPTEISKPANQGGEHRQVTVMFCDLVGSTALSNTLEPEDLQEVLRLYQNICANAIEGREGMVAKYQGDGVMAYFGFPIAREDAAVRAVEAGLEIIREIGKVAGTMVQREGVDFATRIAIHTGRVLISEMGAGETRERHALTGVVPNLASRLEQVAPRNGLVISGQTRALVERLFRIETLGTQKLKGFMNPVVAYRVLGRRPALAVLPARGQALAGRDEELLRLKEIWNQTVTDTDRATRVAVMAEPGTGKSALAAAFLGEAGVEQSRVIEFAGVLSDQNRPFAALRHTIERWTTFAQMRSAEHPATQIARWFGEEALEASPHAEIFHKLWQGPVEPGTEGRAHVFDACRALLEHLPKPLIVVVEDAHWVDPSTFEILETISGETPGVMLLALSRPGHGICAHFDESQTILLGRLSEDACKEVIEQAAGGPVERGLTRRITDVANGLPLFLEEYTKSLLAAGKITRQRGVIRPAGLRTEITTPSSLLDLITMRLDGLGEAKDIAEICAVLGRSFSRDALGAVADKPDETVEAALDALQEAGMIARDWSGLLTFEHALFQKVAYEGLVRSARQKWHGRYLDWLDERPTRRAGVLPETIGFHLEACGHLPQAASHYLEAGLSANSASASLEAAEHFRKCADLIGRSASEDIPEAMQLRVQVLLAGALLSARGPGAPETRDAYDRAVELAEETAESEWHFTAYWGWWRVSNSFAQMAERARRLLEISQSMKGLEFKLQAKHCVWANTFQMGEFDVSISNAREGLALYDAGGFEDIGTLYGGHDCKVCAHGEIALASWLKGAGNAAVADIDDALTHAEQLDHLGSTLHGLDIAVMLHHYRRDTMAASKIADRLRDLSIQHDLEDYRAKSELFDGWVEIENGAVRDGLARVDAAFETLNAISTPEDFPVYQCIRAAALARLGDQDAALSALADGRATIAAEGVNYWGAELARHEALVEMARRNPDKELVQARLREALDLAARQGALALELRAATTLLEFERKSGAGAPSAATLEAIRKRFAPDATGRDLDDADAALTLLHAQ